MVGARGGTVYRQRARADPRPPLECPQADRARAADAWAVELTDSGAAGCSIGLGTCTRLAGFARTWSAVTSRRDHISRGRRSACWCESAACLSRAPLPARDSPVFSAGRAAKPRGRGRLANSTPDRGGGHPPGGPSRSPAYGPATGGSLERTSFPHPRRSLSRSEIGHQVHGGQHLYGPIGKKIVPDAWRRS
jgi:hypothetical protein